MMEVVVISNPDDVPGEISQVIKMFQLGLKHFHIRKRKKTRKQLREYIISFPPQYRDRLILHSYHALAYRYNLGGVNMSRLHRKRGRWYKMRLWLRKLLNPHMVVSRTYHKLSDLSSDRSKYTYAFLSPVFDSVSLGTLSAGYSKRALLQTLPQSRQPIYAMGGITPSHIPLLKEYGFHGVAALGYIWEGGALPVNRFQEILEAIETTSS